MKSSGSPTTISPSLSISKPRHASTLCGNFDEAEQQFEPLLQRAKTVLDKARLYNLRSVQYESMSRYADALAVARVSLELLGVSFSEAAGEKQAARDYKADKPRIQRRARDIRRNLADLKNSPGYLSVAACL